MIKVIKFCVLSVLLTGCATTSELRNNPPDLDVTSVKKAKDVGICIADRLENMSTTMDTMTARQTSNGYSVVVTQNMPGAFSSQKDTIIVVDINDAQNGSRTLFYNNFLAGGKKYFDVMRDCQVSSNVNATPSEEIKKSVEPRSNKDTIPQKIRELESLRNDGVITEKEFQTKKSQLLEKF
jgi:hypothetical protein